MLQCSVDIGFDAVQDLRQKIKFGETLQMVLRRPDRLRADTTKRDGSKNGFVFDGKNLTVFHPQENVYAAVARPGAVDKAVAHLSMTQGQHPLPRRIVITYRHADGRPQFWAQFSGWDLGPAAPDTLFAYTPPPGAVKIAFSPKQILEPAAATTQGGQ